jgi:hypothetical protein
MTASDVGYDPIQPWIKSILGPVHATVRGTAAWALLCRLLAQRATPAAPARALPAEQAGSGRACWRCVRRWWCGPPLEQVYSSPRLIRTALTVLPPGTSVVVALDTTRLGPWVGVERRTTATMGCGRPDQPLVPGWIVVSPAVAAPPPHKQNPGPLRERAARARRHAQHRKHKQGRNTPPPRAAVRRYAQTWGLCTTAPTVAQAVGAYAGRMSIEKPYRDWYHHGAVRAAVVDLPPEAMVTRLIGVVCLAYT